MPKDWVTHMVFARKDFLEQNSETVGKLVKAMTQTALFIKENKSWSVERIKSVSGLSDEGAERQYELLGFTDDGKINVKGVENVLKFLVDYGIITKEQAPPRGASRHSALCRLSNRKSRTIRAAPADWGEGAKSK